MLGKNARVPMSFTDFWAIYPKKAEKLYAKQCYGKALRIATDQEILDGAKKYANFCLANETERQYIKNPSTWLNKGCWDDDFEIPKKEYVSPEESLRKARLNGFHERGFWNDAWGPRPERKVIPFVA